MQTLMMECAKANNSFVLLVRLQETSQCMIKSLTDGISMWIVRCGHRLLDVIHEVQSRYNRIFKTSALIAVNVGQNTIDVEPFVN